MRMRRSTGGALLALGGLLAAFQLVWQALDTQLPDGDEAGHLGAIYLHHSLLAEHGVLRVCWDAFVGPGDYPPLFALLHALLLALVPGRDAFPSGMGLTLTFTSLATLWATARLARRLEHDAQSRVDLEGGSVWRDAGVLAATLLCLSPLWMALSRQTMPEPLLALWVALILERQLASRLGLRRGVCAVTGVLLAGALLTKQTVLLYLSLPLGLLWLEALWRMRARALPGLLLFLGTALPLPLLWFWLHREDQLRYGLHSSEAKLDAALLDQLLYYPQALGAEGLGLCLIPLVLLALGLGLRAGAREGASQRSLLWVWGLPLLMLLSLVAMPKKYPRLLVPMLPVLAASLAVGLSRRLRTHGMQSSESSPCQSAPPGPRLDLRLRRGVASLLVLGGIQEVTLAFPVPGVPEGLGVWEPAVYSRLDPDCPQRWIRRLSQDDLGFQAIVDLWKKNGEGLGTQVALVQEPSIPCRYETTFGYSVHLSDYTRRRGIELDDVAVAELDPEGFARIAPRARVILSTRPWCEDGAAGELFPQTCVFRPDFELAATVPARSERLSFTLYLYRRIRAGMG